MINKYERRDRRDARRQDRRARYVLRQYNKYHEKIPASKLRLLMTRRANSMRKGIKA